MHNIYKWVKNGGGKGIPVKMDEVETLREVWDYFDSKAARYSKKNIYYQVNPSITKHGKKAKKDDIINSVAIPIDVDGFSNRDDIKRLEIDITEFFDRAGITSYITINSGNGLHALIHIGKKQANYVERYKDSILKILYTAIQTYSKRYDAHVDTKALESARILRVPFTINEKTGKDQQECSIISDEWDEENNNEPFLEAIEHGVEDPKINVMFDEIVKAFEDIGAQWKHSSDYSFIEHPERGNLDNLCLYRDARFFWNFSDNDTKKAYSMEDVWNWFGSGKPYPFIVGKTGESDLIMTFLRKKYDIRYGDQAKSKIIYDLNGNIGYMTETNYKNELKKGFKQYVIALGMPESTYNMATLSFKDVIDSLPPKPYLADPIQAELDACRANLTTMWTSRFEYFDDEAKKNLKASLAELIKAENYDVLDQKGIKHEDNRFCITYAALCDMFGDPKRYAISSEEFMSILSWAGVETSPNGAICYIVNKKITLSGAYKDDEHAISS